jgi:hypothetical protein
MQVQYLLDNHQVLDIDIQAIAPRIIVLESLHDESSIALIADLGFLHLSSNLPEEIDPETLKSHFEWQDRLYDKYALNMSNLQLKVARVGDAWQTSAVDESMSIIKPFNIDVQLGVLISDPTPTLPKIKYVATRAMNWHTRRVCCLLLIHVCFVL